MGANTTIAISPVIIAVQEDYEGYIWRQILIFEEIKDGRSEVHILSSVRPVIQLLFLFDFFALFKTEIKQHFYHFWKKIFIDWFLSFFWLFDSSNFWNLKEKNKF